MTNPNSLSSQQKAALRRQERAREQDIIRQYQGVWQTLKADLDQVTSRVKAAQAAGMDVKPDWIRQQYRLDDLMAQTQLEIQIHAQSLEGLITRAQAQAVIQGQQDAQQLIRASLGTPPAGVSWMPRLPVEAVNHLIGFSADGKPLGDLLATLGPSAAQELRTTLVRGLAAGYNPRKIALEARNSLGGDTARALTIARTEVLRSYRESSLATYRDNSDVVDGWVWSATLDGNTCAVCIAMNGQVSDTDESLASHPNCRCACIPKTKTWADLGYDVPEETSATVPSGEEWFAKQDASVQKRILGPGKYDAYRQGKIQLSDLVQHTHSRQWGAGRREASLKTALAKAR